MKPITLHLGLDVHKDSITIAIAQPGSKGEIRIFSTITNDVDRLEKLSNASEEIPAPLRHAGYVRRLSSMLLDLGPQAKGNNDDQID